MNPSDTDEVPMNRRNFKDVFRGRRLPGSTLFSRSRRFFTSHYDNLDTFVKRYHPLF